MSAKEGSSHPSYAEIVREHAPEQTAAEKAAPQPPEVEEVLSEEPYQKNEKVVVLDEEDADAFLHPEEAEAKKESEKPSDGEKKGKTEKLEKEAKSVYSKACNFVNAHKVPASAAISINLLSLGAISAYLLKSRQSGTLNNRTLCTCTAIAGIVFTISAVFSKTPKTACCASKKSNKST
ncbi:hypothetical protein POMI540_1646 [Schizosaccharomyces pombe]|uniref:Uncharacterized protein C11C11.06c n=1 Tax=Schizosaccharomyces pombe (strain 972 / ATCC 24843) TaxID=284812 RepID=YBY6_SCHPO|nr:uncharacterized protein SPBC11C11.06c [Schizosaccharomyces pombe]Q10195.1 RecName: Full=Uncharacterized protein C11C11.06c [Schizosaccharomyces pombe 972h-]CAA20688.1 sequence orphan [Schizosaccharomyces pombe]|eukprot:NP_596395.1 uncharacterized protein SPBC11C11.06c [Schizosaccharomyces pombe]